jgi:signal transduction histidine kinase/CRP-like cAMP-binding protein
MTDIPAVRLPTSLPSAKQWLAPGIVLVYQIISIVALAAMPIFAFNWLKTPFLGAFVEHTLYLSASQPSIPGSWPLLEQVNGTSSQLTAINGQPVVDIFDIKNLLAGYLAGDRVVLSLRSEQGVNEVTTTLIDFPAADQIAYFYIPYMIALIYLGCSIWVFSLRRRDPVGRAFAIFSASAALGIAGQFDMSTTNILTYLWTISIGLISGSLISLALLFPQEHRLVTRYPFLYWLGYLVSFGLIVSTLPSIYNLDRPLAYILGWRLEYIFIAISILVFIGLMVVRYYTTSYPVVKEQSRLILIGSAISFGPIGIWFLVTSVSPQIRYTPYLLLPVVLFPLMISYAILRYRMLNTDYIFSRTLAYTLVTVLAAAGYALLVAGLTLLFGNSIILKNTYITGIIIFLLALSLIPLRNFLQRSIDAVFSHSQAAYRLRLQAFGRELTRVMELPAIIKLLNSYVQDNLNPVHLHIFTHDPLTDQYAAAYDPTSNGQKLTSDLRFSNNSALVASLAAQNNALLLGESRALPTGLQSEQARIALLNSQLFVPLPGRRALAGWLAMGPRSSGEAYNTRDLEFLESLCDQAALAIERAQVVADLERRVHAMNVLTRVSQGINVTLAFDDILELIYAQTNQIVPTLDFRISLYDRLSDYLYYVFYLENDERLVEKENLPIPIGQGLEREVLQNRRQVITDDYERECRSRGSLPGTTDLLAWAGVPLNTGAETIGVLSIASRDPSVIYTVEQVNLLQAIADQAAGAIVKARLLQEAERRTRQLTTLNEVARSLTSTLAIEPLLEQILYSAVEILNCEAGSLLLVEEETGDLVFKVASGPVGADLVGKHLTSGTGLVGKAVDTRLPIIQNDVRRSKEWFDKPDEQTGFTTNDILVVPMQVKDRISGVIEVINRRDSLPFTADDQELLMAFTSQAAVALENARLYTLTDQSLTDRVEELSVMQRIDRELNASLDISRAMRITLEWAMRQSKADAGLVGIIDADKVRIMTAQGYTNELEQYPDSLLPANLPSIQASISSGQPQWIDLSDPDYTALKANVLANALTQAIIPIRREQEVIGIVILESLKAETYPSETQAFLSRLSDHAAIAISNAQLYAAVQAANLAKSDFVSFVSHELKTPMTSIKGFTDLLAAGVVGPVNEAQGNFLSTIRSNVDRMATLVSDLADVSRIEAGRLRLDFAPVRVMDMIEDVVRSARSLIEEKEQKLTLNVDENPPAMWGDRTRLIQVLTNLVNNAYKYTPAGGEIILKAEYASNQWNPEGAEKVIHISVKDSGIGISPENQKKIFQKFFRADDQKVRDIPGTGLGLNITKTLVEMQGGQIWFESVVDVGTTFHFTIPVAEGA